MMFLSMALALLPLTGVIPAKAGISVGFENGDPRLRGDDVGALADVGCSGGQDT
jgi:hypothetical protein